MGVDLREAGEPSSTQINCAIHLLDGFVQQLFCQLVNLLHHVDLVHLSKISYWLAEVAVVGVHPLLLL